MVLRIAFIQTISKTKNENYTSRLGVESRIVKKGVFPQNATVVYNVLKSNFEYLHSRWKYSHLIRVLF